MLATHLIVASLAASAPDLPAARPETMSSAFADAGVPTTAEDAQAATEAPEADQSIPDPGPSEASAEVPPAEAAPSAAPAGPHSPQVVLLGRNRLDNDPLEGFNRVSFAFSQAVDKALIRPLAMAYRHGIPKPLRDGLHNINQNLKEPIVFINDLLQLRPGRALRTLLRFVINSTLGLGGLFDIARREPFNLAHHDNSFGDTLGYYGVGPGPYLYLPIFGPTALRDMVNNAEAAIPVYPDTKPFNRSEYTLTLTISDGLDQRERNDFELQTMLADSVDPYARFRADYLQDRQAHIEDLKARAGEHAAVPAFDDPLLDPAAPGEPAPAGQ